MSTDAPLKEPSTKFHWLNRKLTLLSRTVIASTAIVLALTSSLSRRSHSEIILLQDKANAQQEFYETKHLSSVNLAVITDALGSLENKNDNTETLYKQFQNDLEHLRTGAPGSNGVSNLLETARELEMEVHFLTRRADLYDCAVILLELSLMLTSITLLTGHRFYWFVGSGLAIVGITIVVIAFIG